MVWGDAPSSRLMNVPKCDWLMKPRVVAICLMLRSGSVNIVCARFASSSLISLLAVLPEICLQTELKYFGVILSLVA